MHRGSQFVSGHDGTDAGHYHRPCPLCRDVDGAIPVIRSSVSLERPMAWGTMQTSIGDDGEMVLNGPRRWSDDATGVGRERGVVECPRIPYTGVTGIAFVGFCRPQRFDLFLKVFAM